MEGLVAAVIRLQNLVGRFQPMEISSVFQLRLCSDLSRSLGACVLLLTGTKQSLDVVAREVSSVGYLGCSGRSTVSALITPSFKGKTDRRCYVSTYNKMDTYDRDQCRVEEQIGQRKKE